MKVNIVFSKKLPSFRDSVLACQVQSSQAAAVDSATVEPSNLAKLALWPQSCIQWCSPALTRPAVDTAVGFVVHIFAAAAALSVVCC